ncbi:MAG: N-glycosylase/DNA lyase [Candidatus Omnitrophica bacterium]|nr:N-glycosylase/DNA lyase [Candidatus Omnitrophota bacterium]
MDPILELKKSYRSKRREIEKRLLDFRKLRVAAQSRIFEELCFCLLTAGANAENCKKIITRLKGKKLLLEGNRRQLGPFLKYARFYNQKACRLVAARKFFSRAKDLRIKEKVFCGDPSSVREWLVKNVSGLGYKEASHFLRNVGQGEKLAILDRHILRRLKELSAIEELPKSLTPKKYLEIEQKMLQFSKRINIPIGHMDLLFFSSATGKPVKYCK